MHVASYAFLFFVEMNPKLPKVLFIANTTTLTSIKNDGFKAKGSNDDVYAHARCEADSALIDLTVNMTFAVRVWGPHLLSHKSGIYYVYKIEATKKFYNLSRSLDHIYAEGAFMGKKTGLGQPLERVKVSPERWIAIESIHPSHVLAVCSFRYDAGSQQSFLVHEVSTKKSCVNVNDRIKESHGNSGPYIPKQPYPLSLIPSNENTDPSTACSDCFPDGGVCNDGKSMLAAVKIEAEKKVF